MRLLCLALLACLAPSAIAQTWPLTRAERTDYKETSHYENVVSFLHDLQSAGAPIWVTNIGKSTEGKEIPLAIASFPRVSSAAQARRLGKPIVYIQANIHAGEVEGKEAAMIVLRRLLQEGPKGLLGKMVLLVAPIYNIDGNEKFGPVAVNRPEQDGPAMVGLRPNGQGLDLNRDAIKAESPEARGAIEDIYNTWDPDVMLDLHTTDGTRHGWELTYSPPLNPNTLQSIMRLDRDQMIPFVRREIQDKYGLPLFDYGNTERRNGKVGWYTFGQEGRYWTNYVGLRNRLSVLSEATTYIPFKARVSVTDKFVTSILQYVADHARAVMETTRDADAQVVQWGLNPASAPPLGVRFEFASRGEEDALLEKKALVRPDPTSRPAAIEKVRMPIYDRFKATKTAKFPSAYLIPPSEEKTVALLREHGIVVEKLLSPWKFAGEQFTISEVKIAGRPFQGHRLMELNGSFSPVTQEASSGAYLVRTAQPLGLLAFHILEPESDDGAMAWGFMGEGFSAGQVYPILKTFDPVNPATIRM
ncbi:MAG TPA: M14 family metallopeptidase [Fimbriimonas sp.]|nr:M14 family metallopeptidase [Fimbriimonas sp.]